MDGTTIRSRTLIAISGDNKATTWLNLVFWTIIPCVLNCASTWANHTCWSEAQYGESLMLTVATVPAGVVVGTCCQLIQVFVYVGVTNINFSASIVNFNNTRTNLYNQNN